MRATRVVAAVGLAAVGCSGAPDAGGPPAPVPESALGDDRRAAAPDPSATQGGTVHAELGQAPGGVVARPDGTELDLATTYSDSNALIIFYRGHW